MLGIARVDELHGLRPCPAFVDRFPISFARQHAVVALLREGGEAAVVLPGPEAWPAFDTVDRVLGIHAQPLFAAREEILRAINSIYEQERLAARRDLGFHGVATTQPPSSSNWNPATISWRPTGRRPWSNW